MKLLDDRDGKDVYEITRTVTLRKTDGGLTSETVGVPKTVAVAVLGMLPSDAPGFFLLTGAHLIACGLLGVTCAWVKQRDRKRHLFCWTSMIVNAALVVRVAILIIDGTERGPLIVATPLLLGLPAALNVVSAALNLRRGARQIA